ncbi:MAG: gliding motility-related protein [Bacteroidetes bacterium]|jgi:hypothetical protein|nr:gliding motility-related protein [Bacteroidota bacterium]
MKKHYSLLLAFIAFAGTVFATGHTVTPTVMHHVTCPGGTDGKAYVTVSGGVGPYTYSWNSTPQQTTDTLSGVPAGNYVCMVTDQSDMSVTTATLTINAGIGIIATNSGPACAFGGTIQLMSSSGTNVSWSGPMGFVSTMQNPPVTNLPPGVSIYTVTATSSSGCIASATTSVTVSMPIITASATNATCSGLCDGTGTAMASGGFPPYTYFWTPGMSVQNPTNLCAGTYTVMVTDAMGCTNTTTTFVQQPSPLTGALMPTQPSSCGACDGSIQSAVTGGTGPYVYSWSTGTTTQNLSNLCPGTYSLSIIDMNGCTFSSFTTLTSGGLTASVNALPDTCGHSVGSATANISGAQGPVTYLWQPGNHTTQSIFNVPAGNYSLTVYDSVCAYNTTVTIGNTNAPTIVATSNAASCGNANGLLVLTASGGTPAYMYSINGGAFSPNQTYNNMAAGVYTLVVQDANGCQSTSTHTITNSGMNVYFSTGVSSCGGSNATSYAYTAGGGTGPYTYLWSNGATTQTVNNLAPGVYTCTITDNTGCVATGTTNVQSQATLFMNWSCAYSNCGINTLDATVQNGTGPYTYLWSPGGQTTPVITNQAPGIYVCTVTDVTTGCTGVGSYYIYNADYSVVSGNVYADLNGNCSEDPGEQSILPMSIVAYNSSGQQIAWATANYTNGNFQIYLPPTAGTYTLQLQNSYFYSNNIVYTSCSNNVITLTAGCDTLQNIHLGYSPTIGQDLRVQSYCSIARAGFNRWHSISYFNPGTVTTNATVKFRFDNLLSFIGSTPPPTAINGNVVEWNVGNLTHGQYGYIYANTQVPTIQAGGAIGTPLHDSIWIEPIVGDSYAADNYNTCYTTITASYDPNMKEVYAENMDATGAIDTSATELFYTVHFQNTGTDTAFTIVVRDTISSLLDLGTLEMIAASHPYTFSIEPGRSLQVRFDNILLVDSNANEALSHGYFHYKIRTNGGLNVGQQVDNTAAIYFDFNLPVITNTVETPVQLSTVGIKNTKTQLQALVFPNPSNTGSFTIRINDATYKQLHFTMYNASGMKVSDKQLPSQPTHEINTSGLGSGIYFYQLINADGKKLNGKIILTN